jgi:hypothetical protein
VHEWRITKYDPRLRDERGAYTGDDWTAADDIGRWFGGRELTLREYLETEDRYVEAALACFDASGVPRLVVEDLETLESVPPRYAELGLAALLEEGEPLRDGRRLGRDGIARAIRLALRELAWCRLESHGRFFIHVGYDFYMYVGSRAELPDAIATAEALGLYVERFDSPYLPRIGG